MAQDDWQARMTRAVAAEIRHWRETRKLSAQDLANRCAELGLAIPRPVLSNLENGRREAVSIAEVLVLARALEVPPILLISPVGRRETVEMLPGQEALSPWDAACWISGTARLRDQPEGVDVVWADDDDVIPLFMRYEELVEYWREIGPAEGVEDAAGNVIKTAADMKREAVKNLLAHWKAMRGRGLLPPPLPAELEHQAGGVTDAS